MYNEIYNSIFFIYVDNNKILIYKYIANIFAEEKNIRFDKKAVDFDINNE